AVLVDEMVARLGGAGPDQVVHQVAVLVDPWRQVNLKVWVERLVELGRPRLPVHPRPRSRWASEGAVAVAGGEAREALHVTVSVGTEARQPGEVGEGMIEARVLRQRLADGVAGIDAGRGACIRLPGCG